MNYIPLYIKQNGENKVSEWSLVLDALDIDHKIKNTPNGPIIEVIEEKKQRAIKEILEYEKENEEEKEKNTDEIPRRYYSIESTLWILFFLFLFHIITQNTSFPFIPLGCMDSFAIYKGEWWRIITAITLHKNIVHILSNIFWQGVFMYFLLRTIRPSIAWAMSILGGITGNLLNYFYHNISHVSLGFSTCVFATLGISIGIRSLEREKKWGIFIMSGLGIFAMLGIGGARVDVSGHLFGFISGFLIGIVSHKMEINKIPIKDLYIFGGIFLIILTSWTAAFLFGKNYLQP